MQQRTIVKQNRINMNSACSKHNETKPLMSIREHKPYD